MAGKPMQFHEASAPWILMINYMIYIYMFFLYILYLYIYIPFVRPWLLVDLVREPRLLLHFAQCASCMPRATAPPPEFHLNNASNSSSPVFQSLLDSDGLEYTIFRYLHLLETLGKKQGRAFTHVSLTCMPPHSFAGLPTEPAKNENQFSLSKCRETQRKCIEAKRQDKKRPSFCNFASFVAMDAFASDEARRFRERILSCILSTPMFFPCPLSSPDQVCYGLLKFLRCPVLGSGRFSIFMSFHFVNQGSVKVGVTCPQRMDVP